MSSEQTKSKMPMLIAAFAIVIAMVAYFALKFEVSEDKTPGAMVEAERYRGAQMSGDDLQLGDEAVPQLMMEDIYTAMTEDAALAEAFQSDTFRNLLASDAFRNLMGNEAFRNALATDASRSGPDPATRIMSQGQLPVLPPVLRDALASEVFRNALANEAFRNALSNEAMARLMSNDTFRNALATDAFRALPDLKPNQQARIPSELQTALQADVALSGAFNSVMNDPAQKRLLSDRALSQAMATDAFRSGSNAAKQIMPQGQLPVLPPVLRDALANEAFRNAMANDSFRSALSTDAMARLMSNEAFRSALATDAFRAVPELKPDQQAQIPGSLRTALANDAALSGAFDSVMNDPAQKRLLSQTSLSGAISAAMASDAFRSMSGSASQMMPQGQQPVMPPVFINALANGSFRNALSNEAFRSALSSDAMARLMSHEAFRSALASDTFRALPAIKPDQQGQIPVVPIPKYLSTALANDVALNDAYVSVMNDKAQRRVLSDVNLSSALSSDTFRSALSNDAFRSAMQTDAFRSALGSDAFRNVMSNESFRSLLSQDTFRNVMATDAFRDALASENFRNAFGSDLFRQALATDLGRLSSN